LGASTRAALSLVRCAQARALLAGRAHVLPDDLKALAPAVLGHRVVPLDGSYAGGFSARQRLVAELVGQIAVQV
jgi:MoxR-like ATPase